MNAFSTGNLQTLHEVPESKGMNIRQLMIDFYQKFYSANIMKVAVYGKEPLDVMERWVVEKFSKVPNKNLSPQHFPTDPFRYEQTRKLVEFVPVR
jgi:insulysin